MKRIFIFLSFGLLINACSYIIILHDPLSAKEHVELGYTYEKQKDYKNAIYQYKMAIRKDSHYDLAYFDLGNVYVETKNYEKAVKCYKKAIELNSKNANALNNLAYAYYKLGDYEHAKFCILKALKLNPNNKDYINTLKEINSLR